MKIYGHVAAPPEHQVSRQGKPYCTFRLAENYGSDENRRTVWFDVKASIDPLDADLIERGQAVEVDGRLDPEAYLKKRNLAGVPVPTTWEGVAKVLKERDALGVGLKVLTMSVKPHLFERRETTAGQGPRQTSARAYQGETADPSIPF